MNALKNDPTIYILLILVILASYLQVVYIAEIEERGMVFYIINAFQFFAIMAFPAYLSTYLFRDNEDT